MREIRFRAWNTNNGMRYMDNDFFIGADGTVYDRASRTYDTPNLEIESVDKMILMQFTGLRDSKGVEIYEGDIVRQYEGEDYSLDYFVKWYQERCGFWLFTMPMMSAHLDLSAFRSKLTVIGNIHENPELLKATP